ncbi:ABC transporter ATP-binding protein [Cohnella sp. WQ 127256]|uniref:ABC transporter ATP-binding protein n=1 Tax=Cohnella sp. WQ 127256 TaxID=2938790 RepID=UPI0021180608|nr:ABC transporter ATP-binding protein [Cohnella sp. WQ 127256]
MSDIQLQIDNLSKSFHTDKGSVQALHDVDLQVERGEFITIIGASGCGKSTLLKLVAGLDTDYEGSIELNGKPIPGPGINVGFVFQEPRLFPWLNVENNIAADLSVSKGDVRGRVNELLEIVRLTPFAKSYPKELSGGMSQRVAIARALLREPEILLLDEPFGALDAFTRAHLQEALLEIWHRKQRTMILVTHDLDEAVFLANKVVVMNSRPGTIRRIIPIDLPFPRKKNSESFQAYRRKVLGEFEQADEL